MGELVNGDGTLWSRVEARAAVTPEGVLAVDDGGTTLTFAALLDRAEAFAGTLSGVGPDSVVAWQLPNWLDALVVMAGLSRTGCMQVPLIHTNRDREVGFAVAQTGADLLILPRTFRGFDHAAMAERVAPPSTTVRALDRGETAAYETRLLPPPATGGPADRRWCFYTSGTTSDPKGARHDDRTLDAAARAMIDGYRIDATDRSGIVFPIAHIAGPTWLHAALQTGCRLLLTESFDPRVALPMLSREGVTITGGGAPFVLTFLDAQAESPDRQLFPGARAFTSGAGPKPSDLHARTLQELGAPLLSAYGCTECPILAIASPGDSDEALATTEGMLAAGVEVKVIDDSGAVLGPDLDGELLVRAPQLFHGYVDGGLDAEAFDADGFFRTGDIVRIDAAGHVRVTGRAKDIIIRKGENISAREVEQVIEQHPAVLDVAVIALPDSLLGERCCAVVVLAPGATLTLEDLAAFLRERDLSVRKVPEQLEVRDALPRDDHKKLLKRDLVQELGGTKPPRNSSA